MAFSEAKPHECRNLLALSFLHLLQVCVIFGISPSVGINEQAAPKGQQTKGQIDLMKEVPLLLFWLKLPDLVGRSFPGCACAVNEQKICPQFLSLFSSSFLSLPTLLALEGGGEIPGG